MIDEYISTSKSTEMTCPLAFWKSFQYKFPVLTDLAKKYLGVQAVSVGPVIFFPRSVVKWELNFIQIV